MVEVRYGNGYYTKVSRIDKDGSLFDRNGYYIGKVGEEKILELKLAEIKEKRGERQRSVLWVD